MLRFVAPVLAALALEAGAFAQNAQYTKAEMNAIVEMQALFKSGKTVREIVAAMEAYGYRKNDRTAWGEGDVALALTNTQLRVDKEAAVPSASGSATPANDNSDAARLTGFIAGAAIGSGTALQLSYWTEYVGAAVAFDASVDTATAGNLKVRDLTNAQISGEAMFGVQFGHLKPRVGLGIGYSTRHDDTLSGVRSNASVLAGAFGVDAIFGRHLVAGVTLFAVGVLIDGEVRTHATPNEPAQKVSIDGHEFGFATSARMGYLF